MAPPQIPRKRAENRIGKPTLTGQANSNRSPDCLSLIRTVAVRSGGCGACPALPVGGNLACCGRRARGGIGCGQCDEGLGEVGVLDVVVMDVQAKKEGLVPLMVQVAGLPESLRQTRTGWRCSLWGPIRPETEIW